MNASRIFQQSSFKWLLAFRFISWTVSIMCYIVFWFSTHIYTHQHTNKHRKRHMMYGISWRILRSHCSVFAFQVYYIVNVCGQWYCQLNGEQTNQRTIINFLHNWRFTYSLFWIFLCFKFVLWWKYAIVELDFIYILHIPCVSVCMYINMIFFLSMIMMMMMMLIQSLVKLLILFRRWVSISWAKIRWDRLQVNPIDTHICLYCTLVSHSHTHIHIHPL